MVEAVPPSAVLAVEPCFVGCVLASELDGVAVAPKNVGLEPDPDAVEEPLAKFVIGLVVVSAALSAGLLRFENIPPEAVVAGDDIVEPVAAPPRFPNRVGGAPFAVVVVLALASCAEFAGVADGRLNAGFDEG